MAASAVNQVDGEAYIRRMFSPGFVFPQQDTDDNLKVEIIDLASFGGIADTTEVEPYEVTQRRFHPGKYKVTVIKTHKSAEEEDCQNNFNDPLLIFHHEDINPNLLARQVLLMSEDYQLGYGCENSINRLDWCHGRGFTSEDEENEQSQASACEHLVSLLRQDFKSDISQSVPIPDLYPDSNDLIFFTEKGEADKLTSYILKNQVRRSSCMKHLLSVQDDNGKTVSICIDYRPFNNDDFMYGNVFQDTESGSCFALIVHGYLEYYDAPWVKLFTEEEKKEMGFTTQEETGNRFPMSRFLVKEK